MCNLHFCCYEQIGEQAQCKSNGQRPSPVQGREQRAESLAGSKPKAFPRWDGKRDVLLPNGERLQLLFECPIITSLIEHWIVIVDGDHGTAVVQTDFESERAAFTEGCLGPGSQLLLELIGLEIEIK